MGTAVRRILPLAILSASVRLAAAEATADTNDVPSAASARKGRVRRVRPHERQMEVSIGGGAINGPRYPGSRYDSRAPPSRQISYGRFFIGAVPGGGAPAGAGPISCIRNIGRSESTLAGRPQAAAFDHDPILRGWGDIKGTARGGAFASYTRDWLSVRGSISDDIGGHHEAYWHR